MKSSYTFNASTFECNGAQLLFKREKKNYQETRCNVKQHRDLPTQAPSMMKLKTLHFAWMQNQIIYFNTPKANQTSAIVLLSSVELWFTAAGIVSVRNCH